MKAIYQLRERVDMFQPQNVIAEIIAENIDEVAKIAKDKYAVEVTHVSNLAGLHSYAGTYSLLYKGVVEKIK